MAISHSFAVTGPTWRDWGPCRRDVHTQLASAEREARRTVSHARGSGFFTHGCPALKLSAAVWTQAVVSGLRAARQACVCASPCRLRCSSKSAFSASGGERASGSASSRLRALPRSANSPRCSDLTSWLCSRSRIGGLIWLNLLVEEEMEES